MHRITSPDVTTALHGGNMLINSYYKSQELYFVCLCNICLQQGGSSWVFSLSLEGVSVTLFVCLFATTARAAVEILWEQLHLFIALQI